jgi:hypothetical protein
LRRDWDTSLGAAENVRRCALFATWRPLLVVSRFKAASLVAALNISRGSLYAQISTKAGDFGGQPVPIFGGGATRFSDPSTV